MHILVELRKEAGMNQQQLAAQLGVSRSTVAMWETGASRPDHTVLAKLAALFDTSTDYLLGLSPHREKDAQALPRPFFRFAKQAMELGLTQNDMDAILNLYRQHQADNAE